MVNKKSKIVKIILFFNLFLLLAGAVVVANHIFFREIEIKITGIEWVEEFKIEIAEIEIKNKPSVLIINPDRGVIEQGRLQLHIQHIEIGHYTNSKILLPLRITSEEARGNFFVPQFTARIKGAEGLEANFSLYLQANECQQGQEKIQGNGFVLCNIGIYSGEPGPRELTRTFNITDRRKNLLADKIRTMVNKNNYVLVLKIAPDLGKIKNMSSFSITIENITPELIIKK
jgi:hypothetical protein